MMGDLPPPPHRAIDSEKAETLGPLGALEHGSHSVGEPVKMPLETVA